MKKIFCTSICFIFIFSLFAQNTRKFELATDSAYRPYVPTGKASEVVMQEGHRGDFIDFLQFSLDGKYLFTGDSVSCELKIWEIELGALVRTIKYQLFGGTVLSPNGKFLIDSVHQNLRVINIETGEEYILKEKYTDYLINTKILFSQDSSTLAVHDGEKLKIYDMKTYKLTYTVELPRYIRLVSFNQDLSAFYFLNLKSNTFGLWEMKGGKKIWQIELGDKKFTTNIGTYKIDLNEKYFICSSYNANSKNTLFIIDIENQKIIRILPTDNIWSLDFLDDSIFYFACSEGVKIYNIKEEKINNLFLTGRIDSVTYNKKADMYALGIGSSTGHNTIDLFRKGKHIKTLKGASNINYFYTASDEVCIGACNEINEFALGRFFSKNSYITSAVEKLNFNDLNMFIGNNTNSLPLGFKPYVISQNGIWFLKVENKKYIPAFYDFQKKEIIQTSIQETDKVWFFKNSNKKICGFYTYSKDMIYIYDTENYKILYSDKAYKDSFGNSDCITYYFSPLAKFAICAGYNSCQIINLSSGKKIDLKGYMPIFRKDEKFLAISRSGSNEIIIYDTESWNISKILKLEEHFIHPICYSQSGKYLFCSNGVKSFLYDALTGKKVQTFSDPIEVEYGASFFDNDSKIVGNFGNSCLKIFSVSTGTVLTSIICNSSGDWITYTPEGYFTGSPGGINKFVHLVDGMQVFELGQMYDTLYRPDLVQAKLEGKDIGKPVLKDIVATGDSPFVQFTQTPMATSRQIKLEFSVQDTGGGIGYVYLSQNGKAMQVSAGEKSKAGQRFIYTCDVTLAKGENVFEAYAANSANKIESRHVSSTLTWQGKVEDSNLYVLAIGVDKYIKMPQNNLKYSVADATGIIESFKASPGGLYGSVNVMTLLDSDVSKDNIQKAFETFASKVKPDDMFVLHLAGHGVNYGGEYYYLPSDTLAKSDSDYPKVGVSKHFLTESLSEIQSLNTIILLDTCYSGAFIDAKAQGNELAQKTALEHLAHTSGQVILTASANSQTAAEGYKGHGIFTYAIMEAISGKANYNADSTLSIKEITQYVGYEVPNIYEKMGLARQSPWNSPLRGDFSVVATGNRQSPQFHEVSLDGGKRTDWVTVRTDDSDVGNFENALASAKKEAKKTSRSSGADQRSRGKGIYVGLGYGNTRFGSGFGISPEFYFLGWKHFYAGVGSDIIYKGAEKSESGKDIRKLDADIKFLLGYSYTFKRLRPYLCGGVGGYFSGDAKEKEIFVSSNSKTGVVTKTVYESDAKTGFVWEVAVGSDILLAEHFVIGAQYKLKNFVNCGFTDTWTVTIGWPF